MRYYLLFVALLYVSAHALGVVGHEKEVGGMDLIDAGIKDDGNLFFTTSQQMDDDGNLVITNSSINGYETKIKYKSSNGDFIQLNRLFINEQLRLVENFDSSGEI